MADDLAAQLGDVVIRISRTDKPLGETISRGLSLSKATKAEVNYQEADDGSDKRCDRCDYWVGGKCELVAGNIYPDWVCDLFEPRFAPRDTPSGPGDRSASGGRGA